MKLYHDNRFEGIFMEHSSEFGQTYLMDQVEFYVTLKLADDPTLDGKRLVERFFTEYYGAAARPMRALYHQIEATFTNPRNYPPEVQTSPGHQHQTAELAWEWLGTHARMAKMGKLMDEAVAAARTDLEKQRVAAFKAGIWDYMVAGRQEYDLMKAAKAQPLRQWEVPAVARAEGDPARVDWSAVPDAGPWVTLGGAKTTRRLQALVAHDGAYLYVRLPDWTDAAKLVSGPNLWDGDGFELTFATEQYAKGLRDYTTLLRKLAPDTPLIWGSSTPIVANDHPEQFGEANATLLERNAAAAALMAELGLPTNDLYALVVDHPGGLG